MKITKTLALATLAALSLGVGTALAQDGGGGAFPEYWSQQRQTTMPAPVQSGASDIDTTGRGLTAGYILNHQLYGAGGVAG
jgi:hypothetical protein